MPVAKELGYKGVTGLSHLLKWVDWQARKDRRLAQ